MLFSNIFVLICSVLKDVPNIPAESYGPRQRDSVRQSVFPNLNYTGLYYAILNMIDIVPTMQMKQIGNFFVNVRYTSLHVDWNMFVGIRVSV